MKLHVGKIVIARRFLLVLVVLPVMAALIFSISAAQEQIEPSVGQSVGNPPPASAGDAQQALSIPPDQASAPQSADRLQRPRSKLRILNRPRRLHHPERTPTSLPQIAPRSMSR